jgi:hypothetical protein
VENDVFIFIRVALIKNAQIYYHAGIVNKQKTGIFILNMANKHRLYLMNKKEIYLNTYLMGMQHLFTKKYF